MRARKTPISRAGNSIEEAPRLTLTSKGAATPGVTVTSAGGLSKVRIMLPFAAILEPLGGFALTNAARTVSSSLTLSSPPQPVPIKTVGKIVPNNTKTLNIFASRFNPLN